MSGPLDRNLKAGGSAGRVHGRGRAALVIHRVEGAVAVVLAVRTQRDEGGEEEAGGVECAEEAGGSVHGWGWDGFMGAGKESGSGPG